MIKEIFNLVQLQRDRGKIVRKLTDKIYVPRKYYFERHD